MADLGKEIGTYLLADAGVAALVGTRFEPDVLPQGYSVDQGGAMTYTTISTLHDHGLNGLSGIARSRIEITTYAKTRLGANEIAEAVRSADLVGYVGTLGDVTIESVMLESGSQSLEEGPTDGSQEHRYLTVFDFLIAYQEAI